MRGGDHPNAALEEKASGGVGIDWSTRDEAPKNEAETKRETNNNEPRLQKVGGEADPVSHNERVLRDALDDHLRKSGMEVIGTDEGQRVLDAANGESKGIRLAFDEINKESEKSRQPMATPSRQRGEISDSDAKVDNRIELPNDYKEKLSALSERIANGEKISPEEFLLAIEKALGGSNENADKSQYFKGKDDATLRLANHRGNARMFLLHDHATGNTSVVVKMSDKRGKKNSSVDLKEFVYFPDKMNANVQQSIVGGLQEWVETGEYNRPCDQIITSVMRNGIREQRMNHGSGDDAGQPRFFRTKDGEAYGFTVGGKIYYDPRIATSETLVHEYAHLWASALRGGNAEEWKNVVGLMKGTSVWDEVKRLYPELKTDDEIADEVIAQYSGRRGAEWLREEAKKIADGDVYGKAEAISAMEKIRRALSKFWKGVCDMLHIHYTSAEEVADRVMKDLLDGVDPRKFGKTDGGARMHEGRDESSNNDGVKARIDAIKNLKPVTVEVGSTRREDVREAYYSLGSATNKTDGKTVSFYHGVFGKMWRGENSMFAKVAAHLNTLFENSLYGFSSQDNMTGKTRRDGTVHKEHRNIENYDYYIAKAKVDEKDFYVRFTIQNERKGQSGVHDVMCTNVEIYENPIGDASTSAIRGERLVSNEVSDTKLMDLFGTASKKVEENAEAADAVSDENVADGGMKFRDGGSPVEKHIAEVSKKVGGKVKMIGSVDEIDNARVRADIENGKKVKGWYDEQTGETCVYLPNVKDTYTAEKVVWHETVGHKGMRGLLGDKGYRDWLKGLWYDLDNAVNADLREYVRGRMAKEGLTMYDAIEEYVADAAEKGKGEPGFWNNVSER